MRAFFVCTTCQNRIKEHGSLVDCFAFGNDIQMLKDTTKLYDKSFICENYKRVDKVSYKQKESCQKKKVYKYKYDALLSAKKIFESNSKLLRPYRCDNCGKWHLSTFRGTKDYNPIEEFNKYDNERKYYD